ncbi:hypothetical protein F0562_008433 [Nyssa sinensis]|uniref:Uncharacterized protein n=1 Tax=Nyssa sinensis TaxID=561372 RepID=A0A5J5A813_9ASTE|nr:hypothetical protein F0562_008433 [Nyssa sinensis]
MSAFSSSSSGAICADYFGDELGLPLPPLRMVGSSKEVESEEIGNARTSTAPATAPAPAPATATGMELKLQISLAFTPLKIRLALKFSFDFLGSSQVKMTAFSLLSRGTICADYFGDELGFPLPPLKMLGNEKMEKTEKKVAHTSTKPASAPAPAAVMELKQQISPAFALAFDGFHPFETRVSR